MSHETEHRQAGPVAGVVYLPENPQQSGAGEDGTGAPGPQLCPRHTPPPARPLTSFEAQASHFVPQFPHLKNGNGSSAAHCSPHGVLWGVDETIHVRGWEPGLC